MFWFRAGVQEPSVPWREHQRGVFGPLRLKTEGEGRGKRFLSFWRLACFLLARTADIFSKPIKNYEVGSFDRNQTEIGAVRRQLYFFLLGRLNLCGFFFQFCSLSLISVTTFSHWSFSHSLKVFSDVANRNSPCRGSKISFK